MNRLQIQNLIITYSNRVRAVDDVSLDIGNGMFGLLGPNGAGKSSLMRTITGVQVPESGTILFNGVDIITHPNYIKQHIGYLPQEFGVYPKISAFELLNHLAILKGVNNKTERKEQVLALLHQTNLYQHRNQAVSAFSGGMRQRFGIAQALLGNPQIILVDEPTAGLDPEERNRFNNLLSEIGEQIIVILSTHLVEDVSNLCTQMAIIHKGRLLANGAPQHFINMLNGFMWTKTIHRKDKSKYDEQYNILSTHLNGGRLNIHVYAKENPGEAFIQKTPDLEDVYFFQLQNTHHHDQIPATI